MRDHRITYEMLNAYVDGELEAAAAARVATAVAEDPVLAREVAVLSRLRLAVAESVETPPIDLPAPRVRTGRGMAVAAGIAVMALILGSVLVLGLSWEPQTDWRARAWQVHRGWSLESVVPPAAPGQRLANLAEAMPGAYVPDLSASRLSLAHTASARSAAGQRILLAGYRGTRGCKISLLIFPPPDGLGEALETFREGDDEAYAWRAGTLGYALLSDGMDPARLRLLAESVRQSSRRHLPFSSETRMALRRSRERSAPCAV